MNYIDLIIFTIIIATAIIGYFKGFYNIFIISIKWLAAFQLAIFFYPDLAQSIKNSFLLNESIYNLVSFVIIFVTSYASIHLLCLLVQKIKVQLHVRQSILKFAGVIWGAAFGIVLSFAVYKIIAVSLWKDASAKTTSAFIAPYYAQIETNDGKDLSKIFEADAVEQKLAGVTESEALLNYSAEFKSDKYSKRPDLENVLLNLVNNERNIRGIKKLKIDSILYVPATQHGKDMLARGYFSHSNPEGLTPFDRLSKLHIAYKSAGENLAHSSNVALAHLGLMKSPGHKANILNPKFGRIAISILEAENNQLMIVQEFRD